MKTSNTKSCSRLHVVTMLLEILYPFTVRTLVKQPDVHHRAHGRERAVCVWDRASA